MRKYWLSAAVVLALLPWTTLDAQTKVLVELHQPPEGRLGFEELWWVDLNNTTRETFTDVWLHGEIREARSGVVYRANSNKFDLEPGRTTLRYRDIKLRDQWHAKGYEVYVLRTGKVPPGNYTYSVTLEPGLGVESKTVFIRGPTPPRLISPRDGSSTPASSPTFSWTPPGGQPGAVRYSLRLAMILSGQTPEQALSRNRPVFTEDGLTKTQLRYPAGATPLAVGKRYAWQVSAEFRDGGRGLASPVWSFSREVVVPRPPMRGVIRPLKITREVSRHGNWFSVTLELTNIGASPLCNIMVKDNNLGFLNIDEVRGRYATSQQYKYFTWLAPSSEEYDFIGRSSTVEIDLGAAGWNLGPGQKIRLSYSTLPVMHTDVDDATPWRIIGRHLRATYGVVGTSGDTVHQAQTYDAVSHTPTVPDINAAFYEANYLITTSPGRLLWLTPGDLKTKDSLLVMMARLAKAKHGALHFCGASGPHVYRQRILEAGARLGRELGIDWLYGGSLLLVGEKTIVPHFPPVTFTCLPDDPLKLNDYPYSNWTGNEAPELAVGRILGTTARDLMAPFQTSLELLDPKSGARFDRSHALFMSGHENGQWKFLRDMVIASQSAAKEWGPSTGVDTSTFHTDYLTTKKRLVTEALKVPFASGGGGIGANSAAEDVLSLDQLCCWLLSYWVTQWFPFRSKLDDLYPKTSQDKYFSYLAGPTIRFPAGFGSTGRTAAVNRARWVKHHSPTRKGQYGTYHFYSDDDFTVAEAAIKAGFKARAKNKDVIMWVGHSNPEVWGHPLYGGAVSGLGLKTGNTRPVVIGSGCHSGDYDAPNSLARNFLKHGASAYVGAAVSMIGGDNDLKWDWWKCWRPWMSIGQGFRALKRFDMTHGPRMSQNDPEYDACEQGEPLRLYLYQMNLYGDVKVGGES